MITMLRYGNTNTFFIHGSNGGLLVDTDYAGTLPAFYRALKKNSIPIPALEYVMATHYHPDHMGLIGELMKQGTQLLIVGPQKDFVHFSDGIFARDHLPYLPIDESLATILSCENSRAFLSQLGISGEIIHTPSHSADSVSLILDNGSCFVGDLGPFEYLEAYQEHTALKSDWDHIFSFHPKRIFYAHAPDMILP